MKRCPACAEEIQDAAVKCRYCGEAVAEGGESLLAGVAAAEIKLRTLLLDLPTYGRELAAVARAPLGYFARAGARGDPLKRAVAFMLQGITLGFVLLTMGTALPELLTRVVALNPMVVSPEYLARSRAVQAALPPALAETWFEQSELILITRVVPDAHFRLVIDRLRALAKDEPAVLELAVRGRVGERPRSAGRARVTEFLLALDPRMGRLWHETGQITRGMVADVLPRYRLKPHVDFLIRNALAWYVACALIAVGLAARTRPPGKAPVFALGARLVGVLAPAVQALVAVGALYPVATLPAYVTLMSAWALEGSPGPLGLFSHGVVPFEILLLVVARGLLWLGPTVFAIAAFSAGVRAAYQVSRRQAVMVAAVGVLVALAAMDVAAGLVALVLAPTGLL